MDKSIKPLIVTTEKHGDILYERLAKCIVELNYHQRGHALMMIISGSSVKRSIEQATLYRPTDKEKT